jgi:murein DD-endopeptidase MepM/ murein hydrolase activator NlpD
MAAAAATLGVIPIAHTVTDGASSAGPALSTGDTVAPPAPALRPAAPAVSTGETTAAPTARTAPPAAASTASRTTASTAAPTASPTTAGTVAPTAAGTVAPTAAGTVAPAAAGTVAPTAAPTNAATERARAVTGRASRNADRPRPTPKRRAWVHPMPGGEPTSCFGHRWGALHAGLDLAAPAGAAVRAVGAGRVVSAGWTYPGYGISVLVRHPNGYLTLYAHLSRVAVRSGQRVTTGRLIGRQGTTGDSTGPHLHFEVHRGPWHQVDPARWLRARGIRVGC